MDVGLLFCHVEEARAKSQLLLRFYERRDLKNARLTHGSGPGQEIYCLYLKLLLVEATTTKSSGKSYRAFVRLSFPQVTLLVLSVEFLSA